MASTREERKALRAADWALLSKPIEEWRQSIQAEKDRKQASSQDENETEKQESRRWLEENGQQLKDLSLAFVAAINSPTLDTELLGALSERFRADLYFPDLPMFMELDRFLDGVQHIKRNYPCWTFGCHDTQVNIDRRKGIARVHAVLSEYGRPLLYFREAVMQMHFEWCSGRWKLCVLHAMSSIDHDGLSNTGTGSTKFGHIDQEGLEALNTEVKAKAPASTMSSSYLTSHESLSSGIHSLNQSITTRATSVFERYLEHKPESQHSTPPESRTSTNRSREASPFYGNDGSQASTAAIPQLLAAGYGRDHGHFPGEVDHAPCPHSDAGQSWVKKDAPSDEVPQEMGVTDMNSQDCAKPSTLSSMRSEVLGPLRRTSLPSKNIPSSLVPESLTKCARATSCPTIDYDGVQSRCSPVDSMISHLNHSTDCFSESTATSSIDVAESQDQFAEAVLLQLLARVDVLLRQSGRLFATAAPSPFTQGKGSCALFDRRHRSRSLSISKHNGIDDELSDRAKTEPLGHGTFTKQHCENGEGNEQGSSVSQSGSSSKKNESWSVTTGAGSSGGSRKRTFSNLEKGQDSSGSPDGKKRQTRDQGSVVRDRFPCIFYAGEPDHYPQHVKRYTHISLLR